MIIFLPRKPPFWDIVFAKSPSLFFPIGCLENHTEITDRSKESGVILCKGERYILLSGVNVATGFLLLYFVNILTGHLGSPERVLFGIKIIMGDLRKKKTNMMKAITEMCCAIKSDTLGFITHLP